ncbi:phosphatidylinositide phosphatase SAC2 isoform X2 [Apis mellifera]|uniref:Phosphatidylinositide phosphatase SAC2 isoform X2 n=1 Tax=Apis mellifera TaxID=7460 RepID=A0A7M7GN68_APIME|nr:phosphatidylinositide phosphatase SAC2 isoform X2 [Apis mellifera]|eukprot:XP_006560153.2 phosphatidylinositide phosphatase SAC2 isoform X2 [Apis mellifera]
MELFRTDTHFIFVKERHSLWCDKYTGEFSAKSDWEWASPKDLECLGILYGIVGKIEQPCVLEPRLMLIKEVLPAGELYGGHIIYKIKSIAFLHFGSENNDIGLLPCKKHQNLPKKKSQGGLFDVPQKATFAKTWGTIKSATNTIKNTTQQAAALATSQVKSTVSKRNIVKDKERFEKRILEELNKIFTETDSFYFCQTGDITNSLQRLCATESQYNEEEQNKQLWQKVDDRFFWNKHMLQDIINLKTDKATWWILPVIQGYVQIEKCKVEMGIDEQPHHEIFNLAIISRRSRFRAGTRYKRRGVDDEGKCANYVETEQLVWYHDHQVSFVQVRGSVPVYWSQPGYKYKPPPHIDRDEAETQLAFEKHFTEELGLYGPVCIVNLVEQTGKEKIIWEAYSNHVLNYNNPDITYTTFDFHEYCRGMHFENVSILVSELATVLTDMGYCWRDKQGTICMQKGVFRVNCIDCLDRTNVVQTALGKAVMEMQFSKLGLIPPDGTLPTNIRQTFQLLWANNGDIISKQYAGTNALKGDYTRTGERKFTGLMKDGVNSANRYYLNRFKDVYRQATIDMMLGNVVNEEVFQERTEEEDNAATAIHVKLLIEDCKKLLIPDPEIILGSWGLIDADPVTGDLTETEMDTILILTRDSYYVADYDDQIDKVTNYQRVPLEDIVLIEFGQPESSVSLFKNKHFHCIRINYKMANEYGYFHMFRSTNLRFFNNMAVVIKTEEESIESLKSICEAISVAMDISNLPKIPIAMNVTLDRRKSKLVNSKGTTGLLDISSFPELTRNVSETQLLALKSAGTKALNNMSEQFSKLNKLSHSFSARKPIDIAKSIGRKSEAPSKPIFTLGGRDILGNVQRRRNSSSSSDDENIGISTVPLEKPENFSHDKNLMEAYTPSIGIIMGVKNADVVESDENNEDQNLSIRPNKLSEQISDKEVLNVPQIGSGASTVSASPQKTPEITIQSVTEDKERILPPSTLNLSKNISHSTGEVDSKLTLSDTNGNKLQTENRLLDKKRSTSEQDLSLNITSSQSESALKSIKTNITNVASPVASTAKDILSPFSKFAKGVQTLGANLDPRKLKTGHVGMSRNLSDHHVEQRRKLQERWGSCQSKLIAL